MKPAGGKVSQIRLSRRIKAGGYKWMCWPKVSNISEWLLLLPVSRGNSNVISGSVKGLMDYDWWLYFSGGRSFRKQRLTMLQQKQQAAVIISSEASTAPWSTRCSAAYSCISLSEGRVQQRRRRPVSLTGCDAAILPFTYWLICRHQVKTLAGAWAGSATVVCFLHFILIQGVLISFSCPTPHQWWGVFSKNPRLFTKSSNGGSVQPLNSGSCRFQRNVLQHACFKLLQVNGRSWISSKLMEQWERLCVEDMQPHYKCWSFSSRRGPA